MRGMVIVAAALLSLLPACAGGLLSPPSGLRAATTRVAIFIVCTYGADARETSLASTLTLWQCQGCGLRFRLLV